MGFDPKTILKGYTDKVEVISRGNTKTIQTHNPFAELKELLKEYKPVKTPDTSTKEHVINRYLGGAVGIINYDAIRLEESTIPDSHNAPQPIMEFGMYNDGIIYDNIRKKPFYFYRDHNRLDELLSNITNGTFEKFSIGKITANMNQKEFADIVNKAKKYVYDGDIFQVVLSRRFSFKAIGDNLTLYKTLRRLNPSPYMYHLKQDNKVTIGASPEMLIRITGNKIETFPIAGTRKVTGDKQRDQELGDELLHDEKERAEHTMLVDLGRNDIGKVSKWGTVHPESLMKIKRFSHVQHIVTHISGEINTNADVFDAFRAVFPAGTVSGAPKIRAMEIIDELEIASRGRYAGAVGYFAYDGACDFAIAIRTIFLQGAKGFVQAGAGIVADSVAKNEFKETEHKAKAMLDALKEASI